MLRSYRPVPCHHDRHGRYCSKCGLEINPPRLTFHVMAIEFVATWLQRGFRATALGLLLAPGQQIRFYLRENRNLLVKPVNYLFVIAAFHYWVLTLYDRSKNGIDNAVMGLSADSATDRAAAGILHWLYDHYYQMQLVQAALLALLLRFVFFRRSGFTLPEFTIAVTYIVAQNTLLQSIVDLFFTPFHRVAPQLLTTGLAFSYNTWSLAQLLRARDPLSIVRVVAAQVSALAISAVLLILVLLLWESWPGLRELLAGSA